MTAESFDLNSGALGLDFANTVEWHASDHPKDQLNNYTGLVAWAETAGILPAQRANLLRQRARERPDEAQAAYDRAIQLREGIYRLFADLSGKGKFNAEDLALVNDALGEAHAHLQLIPLSVGFAWGWEAGVDGFDQILWPVVRSVGELLTSDNLDRVRQCADDRGCGYLFVDTSRNHSRRWCSMESCGNRAKAQRHYKRQQKGE
jgi:predicted RNA-binding Zn ribbon-like protein